MIFSSEIIIQELMLLKDIVSKHKHNQNIALRQGKKQITYKELFKRSEYIGSLLMNKLDSSQNIGILLSNSIDYVVSYFGITFADKVIVPINTNSKPQEIAHIIQCCDISTVISNSINLKPVLEAIGLSGHYTTFINIDDLQLEDENQLTDKYSMMSSRRSEADSVDDVTLILQTSGTTSTQRSVMLTHRNLISNIRSNIDTHDLSNMEKTLILLPMNFSYCNTAQFLTHIYLGAEIIIFDKQLTGKGILEILEKEKITNFNCVPFILQMINNIEAINEYNLKNLRIIFFGAGFFSVEKLRPLLNKLQNVEFVHTYGLTEAGPRVSSLMVKRDFTKLGSVGKPLKNINVKILPTLGEDAGSNRVGELLIYSEGITKGYYNDLESTNKIIKDGWLCTGDLAEIDDDGFIYLKGRMKNIIKSGGNLIHPEEVEEVLLNYSGIKEAVVYGKKHEILMEIPVAKIVLNESYDCNVNDNLINNIRKSCFKQLSSYKVPYEIKIVDALERTRPGKIKRYYLENV